MQAWFRLALPAIIVSLVMIGAEKSASAEEFLHEKLAVFKPILGKTFRGEFANSTPEKPIVDVSKWERAMNGQAIRILHSINDGSYGGESIMMWDAKKEKLVFWYFTTAGFQTQGTLEVKGKEWSSLEEVTGNANGITQVKSTTILREDGSYDVKSEYFADGKWSLGRETHYVEAKGAEVKFK